MKLQKNDNNGEDVLGPQRDGETALAKLKTLIEAMKLKLDEDNTTNKEIQRTPLNKTNTNKQTQQFIIL